MRDYLGDKYGQARPAGLLNQRNGTGAKSELTDSGTLAIDFPRDRRSSFELQLIVKHERRFTRFDNKIISMHARGMTMQGRSHTRRRSPRRDVCRTALPSSHQPHH